MKIFIFILYYLILGTAGITVPWLVNQELEISQVAIGFVTIVVSTVGYNATVKVMQLIDQKSDNSKRDILINLSAPVIALIFTILVCSLIDKKAAIIISIIAYFLSCCLWWFQNWNNKHLDSSPSSTLGGAI